MTVVRHPPPPGPRRALAGHDWPAAPLTREALLRHLRTDVLPSPTPGPGGLRIGAEVELIPIDAVTRRPLPLDGGERSTRAIIRSAAVDQGWTERRSIKADVTEFAVCDGGRITFEPGGQIELSSAPHASASALIDELRVVVDAIRAAAPPDVELLSVGIDPVTAVTDVAPQLAAERYSRMLAHFDRIGPSGARMMRQTASFQVCVDAGDTPALTWRVLNALAPFAVAIFANSPRYEGRETGHRSFRRHVWDTLDPSRTGLLALGGDPAEEYLHFALEAPAFLMPWIGGAPASFGRWLDAGRAAPSDWCAHLSTLFPEVRPRGYFELRSADAVAPEWYAAPLALVAGLVYHPGALRAAAELLGPPSPELLGRAGRLGLRDPAIGPVAIDLASLALAGCEALGDAFMTARHRDEAREFFDRYTKQGRSPADG